ncbi:Restriction of telomere capping protein 5, partial [Frankliniella fusca]
AHFLGRLKKFFKTKGITTPCNVVEYNKDKAYVLIEFPTIAYAQEVVRLFEKEVFIYDNEIISISKMFSDPAPEVVSQLKFGNVPDTFEQAYFLGRLKKFFKTKGITTPCNVVEYNKDKAYVLIEAHFLGRLKKFFKTKGITTPCNVVEYNKDKAYVLIEFPTIANAQEVVRPFEKEVFIYDDEIISIGKMFSDPASEKIHKVGDASHGQSPFKCGEGSLSDVDGYLSDDSDVVSVDKSFSQLDEEMTSTRVHTPTNGDLLKDDLLLENIPSVSDDFNNNNLQDDFTGFGDNLPSFSYESDDYDSDTEPVIPTGCSSRCEWPKTETLILIKGCMKNKDLITSKNTKLKKKGWNKILAELYQKGLYYTKNNAKKAWTRLLKMSEQSNNNWQFHPYMVNWHSGISKKELKEISEAIQASREDELNKAKSKPKKLPLDTLNKEICGVLVPSGIKSDESRSVFKEPAMTFLLISQYKEKKDSFNNDKDRAETIYQSISNNFRKMGYSEVTSDACAKRIMYLGEEYRRRVDMQRLCTGSGSQINDWCYYDAMAQLNEGNPAMFPQKLLSMGAAYSNEERTHAQHHASSINTGAGRKRKVPRKTEERATDEPSRGSNLADFRKEKLRLANTISTQMGDIVNLLNN